MANEKVKYVNNFPVLGILGLIFIYLKLVGTITWSWWWVLAPFWAPLAIVLVIFGIAAIVAVAVSK